MMPSPETILHNALTDSWSLFPKSAPSTGDPTHFPGSGLPTFLINSTNIPYERKRNNHSSHTLFHLLFTSTAAMRASLSHSEREEWIRDYSPSQQKPNCNTAVLILDPNNFLL